MHKIIHVAYRNQVRILIPFLQDQIDKFKHRFLVCVSLIQHKSKYCIDNGDPSGQSTEVDQKSFKTTGDTFKIPVYLPRPPRSFGSELIIPRSRHFRVKNSNHCSSIIEKPDYYIYFYYYTIIKIQL